MVTQPTPRLPSTAWDQPDQRVVLHGISWDDFERILEIRGDQAGVRIAYLDGELELMSPSLGHEATKTLIGRLLEIYALERTIELNGYGSWTVKQQAVARGIEPDECYVLGTEPDPPAPDLAIEVEWTRGGLDKLEIYRLLGVREVWRWRMGQILPYVLRGTTYEPSEGSELLPELDLDLLVKFLEEPSQTQAVRAYLEALRAAGR